MADAAQSNISSYLPLGGGLLGAGLGQMFSNWQNPADASMQYYNRIPETLQQANAPYINAGQQALPQLQGQYGQLTNDPGARLNQIGGSFQQSPGFKFALQQALQGAGHAAAAGGMAGSPEHEQQNMDIASQLGNRDYYNYLQNAIGLYGTGLQGQQNLYNTGAQAGMQQGQDLASLLANQGGLAFTGQNAANQQSGGQWGSLLGGLGTIAGAALGGPAGGVLGAFSNVFK